MNLNAIKEDKVELIKVLGGLLSRGSELITVSLFIVNILSKLS